MKSWMVRTIEVYDSFRQHLLDVKFERTTDQYPEPYVRTCRTSYGSLRPMMVKEEQLELKLNGHNKKLPEQLQHG